MLLRDEHRYDDIVRRAYMPSARRPAMPLMARAAQFMPFAALSGYDAVIREEARLTERRPEPDEDAIARLNDRFRLLRARLAEAPEVRVTCFVPDEKKPGGSVAVRAGRVKRVDAAARTLILRGGACLPLDQILDIDGELFRGLPPE